MPVMNSIRIERQNRPNCLIVGAAARANKAQTAKASSIKTLMADDIAKCDLLSVPAASKKRAASNEIGDGTAVASSPALKRPRSMMPSAHIESPTQTGGLPEPIAAAKPAEVVAGAAGQVQPKAASSSNLWIARGLSLYETKDFLLALYAFGMATTALRAEKAPAEKVAKAIMTSARMCFYMKKFQAASTLLHESLRLEKNPVAFKRLALCQELIKKQAPGKP